MRVALTAVLCFVILGGTWAYTRYDSGIKRDASEVVFAKAQGITKVQIERTFDCFGDAEFGEPAIKVTFGGKDIFLDQSSPVPANEPIEIELEDVEQEQNAITVFANAISPDSFGDDGPTVRAMVVRILYDDHVIAEKAFHAPGSDPTLGGDVQFKVSAAVKDGQDDH